MDIQQLLCHPIQPYSSTSTESNIDDPITTTKLDRIFESKESKLYPSDLDFWQHTRSLSTSTSTRSNNNPISVVQPHSPPRRQRVKSDISRVAWMEDSQRQVRRPRSASAAGQTSVQTRTPWTPLEDNLLQQGYEQGLSWAMISSTYLPHRSRGCCWGRFKTLQNKNLIDLKQQPQARWYRKTWKPVDMATQSSSSPL